MRHADHIFSALRRLMKQSVLFALIAIFSFSSIAPAYAQSSGGGGTSSGSGGLGTTTGGGITYNPQDIQNLLSGLNNVIALGTQSSSNNAGSIADALAGVDMGQLNNILGALNSAGNINGLTGQIDINMLGNVSSAFGNGGIGNILQDAFNALNQQYSSGTLSPAQQQQVYQQMQQLQSALQNFGAMQGITSFAQNGVQNLLNQAGLGNFASSMQDLLNGNLSNPQALANNLSNIDWDKLEGVMSQLGISGPDALAKFLPAGVDPSKLQEMFDKFTNGGVNGLLDQLKQTIKDKISAGVGDIPGLQKALDKLEDWGKKIAGLGKMLGKLLSGGFLGGLFGGGEPPKFPLTNLGQMLSALGTISIVLKNMSVAENQAEQFGELINSLKIDDAMKEAVLLPTVKKDNLFEAFPNMNASEIAALKAKLKDGSLPMALSIVVAKLTFKVGTTINPIKKAKLLLQISKVNKIMFLLPFLTGASFQLSNVIKAYLDEAGLGNLIGGLSSLLDAYKNNTLNGGSGQVDVQALAAQLGNGDFTQLIDKLKKLGNPSLEHLASYLPNGLKLEDLEKVMNGFEQGLLDKAMKQLDGAIGDLIKNALPADLTQLNQLKDNIAKLKDSLAGKIGDAAGGLLGGSGLGDLLGGLGKGLLTGSSANIPLSELGLGNVNIPGVGNLGDLLGQAGVDGSGTLGDALNSGAMDNLGSIIGDMIGGGSGLSICKRYNTAAERTGSGNTRMITGTGDHDEVPDCPSVSCSKDNDLKTQVKDYFNYNPPSSNLKTLKDTSDHDYEVDFGRRYAADSTQRRGGYKMDIPDCKTHTNSTDVNGQPCQDNRWRDACLTGQAQPDRDFIAYKRPLEKDEEPWPGVSGSVPFVDPSDTNHINCMVPKSTENISPLSLDNGWRFRYMCPGDNQLMRDPSDGFRIRNDLFYGDTKCFAPIPKCNLKKDWDIDNTAWKDAVYGAYQKATSGKGSLGLLFGRLSSDQQNAVKDLFKSNSAAPECRPAFWVRLMADSCANQFIGLNAGNPDLVYNPDQQLTTGLSPRFCQPFRTNVTTDFKEEYDPTEYLKNAATAVLSRDYLPWVDRGNPWKGNEANDLYKDWKNRMNQDSERKIQASGQYDESFIADRYSDTHKITDYASQPVERILDPTHPYSPRYDIAMFSDGEDVDDRNLFDGATETKMFPNPLTITNDAAGPKLKCTQLKKKGYFEYDKSGMVAVLPSDKGCPVYCSAVKVDVMRFRYSDYRTCMGCQIDANKAAFWEEQKINKKYYFQKRCWEQFDSSTDMPEKPEDDECIYGKDPINDKEVCGSCTNAAVQWALYAASCIVACVDSFREEAVKYSMACGLQCRALSNWEATERARKRINHKEEPEYGPTKTKTDGKNWPVCSTRYDFAGDNDLCQKAKEEAADNCSDQGSAGEDDPNIGEDKTDYAKNTCVSKKIGDICHDAAKPVYGLNFLKIRPVKQAFTSDDNSLASLASGNNDQDPPKAYQFRTYFKEHRPYMRWWDTGKESFQGKNEIKPEYSCDVGANDTFIGVGRDYNSIHGRQAQICSMLGGDGVGDNCFKMKEWRDGDYPELAGTEWAELKMYQMNCFRQGGLNCLCQYEKIFKPKSSEDAVLSALGATVQTYGVGETACYGESREPCHENLSQAVRDEHTCQTVVKDNTDKASKDYMEFKELSDDGKFAIVTVKKPCEHIIPLGWRGYTSTPTSNEQFPKLYGNTGGSIIAGGLDKALVGDIIIWPAGKGTLPRVARVTKIDNEAAYPDGGIARSPAHEKNSSFEGSVTIEEKNNGMLPDVCGNTSELNMGAPRTLYKNKASMQEDNLTRLHEQVSATYYCENPMLGECVERLWNEVTIFRPTKEKERLLQ